jgi:hypothetical protein
MFQEIPYPQLAPVSCETELIPDASAYFKSATQLGLSAETMEPIVRQTVDPVNAAPMLEMVAASQNATLMDAAAQTLEKMTSDSRGWAMGLGAVTEAMGKLLGNAPAPQAEHLLSAWRTYLVDQYSGTQCAEVLDSNQFYGKSLMQAVEKLNREIQRRQVNSVAPIAGSELKPGQTGARIPNQAQPSSPALDRLRASVMELMFGNQSSGLSDVQKQMPEWTEKFQKYLDLIESLSRDDLPKGDDLLAEKTDLLSAAAMVASPGPLREMAVKRFLGYLALSSISPEQVSEWFHGVEAWFTLCQRFGYDTRQLQGIVANSGQPLVWLAFKLRS